MNSKEALPKVAELSRYTPSVESIPYRLADP